MIISIQNVVANAQITRCDEDTVLKKIPESEYHPNGFPAIGIRKKRVKIWLYKSGKIVSAGAKSREIAIGVIMDTIQRLSSLGFAIKVRSAPRISLVVANIKLDGYLQRSKLQSMTGVYSNEKFQADTFHFKEYKTNVRIFKNKKIGMSAPSVEAIVFMVKKLQECTV